MRVIVMICGMLVAVNGQVEGDEWIDPTDMLNYDSTSKTMRKVDESKGHDDTADNICIKDDKECKDKTNLVIRPNPSACCLKLSVLQQQVEELKNIAVDLKTASGYDPVFERKLGELIESIQKLDFHQEEDHYSTSYEWLLVFAEQCERFLLTWSSTVLTFVWDTSIHNIYPIFMDILKCYEFWAFPAFVTSLLAFVCIKRLFRRCQNQLYHHQENVPLEHEAAQSVQAADEYRDNQNRDHLPPAEENHQSMDHMPNMSAETVGCEIPDERIDGGDASYRRSEDQLSNSSFTKTDESKQTVSHHESTDLPQGHANTNVSNDPLDSDSIQDDGITKSPVPETQPFIS